MNEVSWKDVEEGRKQKLSEIIQELNEEEYELLRLVLTFENENRHNRHVFQAVQNIRDMVKRVIK